MQKLGKRVTFADSLAGVGARGLRVATEVPEIEKVYINDLNPTSISIARKAARINRVSSRCLFSARDCCKFLIDHSGPEERFSIVDVDPFGSPAPFIDCSLRALHAGGLLCLGATDATVLCGIYPEIAWRKYHGYSLNTEYCHEIGIRLILGLTAMTATRLDLGIVPRFAHVTRNYMRVYVSIRPESSEVQSTASNLGHILHCFKCGNRILESPVGQNCNNCGAKMKTSGPLWTASIYDQDLLRYSLQFHETYFSKESYRLLALALEEADIATYFVTDKIADKLQVPTPTLEDVIGQLRLAGFTATRTAFNPRGIRTNAPIKFLYDTIRGP